MFGIDFKQRMLNVLIGFDQFVWVVVTLGGGYPDETISSACYRYEQKGVWIAKIMRPFVDFLFLPFEKDHCRLAYESELNNTQLPKHFREGL